MPLARRRVSSSKPVAVEPLEARTLHATIVLTNPNDYWTGGLRVALENAAPGDTIDARNMTGTMDLLASLQVKTDVTILGPGSDRLTLNMTVGGRVLDVFPGLNVKLVGLTIANGQLTNDNGGGVRVQGSLDARGTFTLDDVRVQNCSGTEGAGLAVSQADVTMNDCRITGNTATNGPSASGGGVLVDSGTLVATNCTFDNNTARGIGGSADTAALGGGVALMNAGASAFTNCTFAYNRATAEKATNVDGATATALGGGLNVAMIGNLTLLNCTFSGNTAGGTGADTFGGGVSVLGFGTYDPDQPATLTATNTVIAGNTAAVGVDAFGLAVSSESTHADLSYNLLGVADDSGVTNGSNHNRAGTAASPLDAKLNGLAYNGGVVPTMAPQAGSPLLSAASPTATPARDARGYPRSIAYDVGAYEKQDDYAPSFTAFPDDTAAGMVPYVSQVSATDVDGNGITFSLVNAPAWLKITDNGNGTATLSGTPSVDDEGANAFTLRASDGTLDWDEPVSINVVNTPVSLSDAGVLRVVGTDGDDAIRVSQPAGAGGTIRVSYGKRVRNFSAAAVTAIQVFSRGGNDAIVANCVDLGAYVQAGDGNDTVVGGPMADSITAAAGDDLVQAMGGDDWIDGNGGRDNLQGGDGNDRIYGGNGRDVLSGDGGSDVLYGEAGTNIYLIADRTRDWVFGENAATDLVEAGDVKDMLYDATNTTPPLVGSVRKR